MHRLSKFAVTVLLTLFSLVNYADSTPADQLIQRLENLDTLYARYSQSGNEANQIGEFWLRKPNRFRIESAPPLSQTIVSDGTSLWTYDRDLEQVIVTNLEENARDIPILLFAGDPGQIRQTYEVETFSNEHLQFFVLTPTGETGVVNGVALAFRNDLPVRLSFENAMQEQTVIEFFDVTDQVGSSDPFKFDVPEFVDVIDDRRQD